MDKILKRDKKKPTPKTSKESKVVLHYSPKSYQDYIRRKYKRSLYITWDKEGI